MTLALGKLPPEILKKIIRNAPILDSRILIGPNIGMDCAIIDNGENFLVLKNDPITFATEHIGWYAVQINSNDIVTTGALPKWMMATILLPENKTTSDDVTKISTELFNACAEKGISFIGGHTEITYQIDRPIISATMIGEVKKQDLITPIGVKIGDDILLTKGVGIEGTVIIANEFGHKLSGTLSGQELEKAKDFIYAPGISIYKDAQIATKRGGIHAMHDPTEGGLSAALWELAIASDKNILFFPEKVPIDEITDKICAFLKINPINLISSGALLLSIDPTYTEKILIDFSNNGIRCAKIGTVESNGAKVNYWQGQELKELPYPARDEISILF